MAAEQVAGELRCDPAQGLADAEAATRLAEHGLNRLAEKPPRAAWRKFLDQLRNFLVIVLIGAAVLAGTVGDLKDAIVIAIVVLLNATLGFLQEHRAEAALAALKSMLAPVARVRRDNRSTLLPAEQVMPGDIVVVGTRGRTNLRDVVLGSTAEKVLRDSLIAVWACKPAGDAPSAA